MIRKILFKILYPLSKIYLSKERNYTYKDITVKVLPGVFHPGLFFSTKILLNYLESIELINKTLLELGAGTGLISIFASKRNAKVTATDIGPTAIKNINLNAEKNNVELNIIHSDLFDNIPEQSFDFIIINPPYFPKNPKTESEQAWFCGGNFEYFKSLFNSLSDYIGKDSKVFMILSEVCDIQKIKSLGMENEFAWKLMMKKRKWGEKNYIFEIKNSKLIQRFAILA